MSREGTCCAESSPRPPTTPATIVVICSVLMQDSKRMAIDPTEKEDVEPLTRAGIAAFPKD